MKGILALLLLCATSHFAAGSLLSAIYPLPGPGATHGLLGTKLLGTVVCVLSVTGSASSDSKDLQSEAQSLVASNKASELGEELVARDSFASSSAGVGGGDIFVRSNASSIVGVDGGQSFAQSSTSSGFGHEGSGDFAPSNGSTDFGNAHEGSSGVNMRKPPCRKPEFTMNNETEYRCFRVGSKARVLNFKVKTAYSAFVALLGDQKFAGPTYELFLGGWENRKSAIKDTLKEQHYAVEVETPDILSENEFRGFWAKWDKGVIMVGKEGQDRPFMAHAYPDNFGVKYLCFFPGSGSGSWIIEGGQNKKKLWREQVG